MIPATYIHISVVIPTCNRPDDIRRCLDSVEAVRYPNWDVVVVDQSDGTTTGEVVQGYANRIPHLRYLALSTKGAARSRNAGVEAATGDYVAFLDDDCTVEPNWLGEVAGTFGLHPEAGLVYGRVIAPSNDRDRKLVPVADIRRKRVWRGRLSILRTRGIGASLSVRRSVFKSVGPFDAYFGPGSGFAPAAEEDDFCYRCLACGYQVVEAPSVVVKHFGAREYDTGAASRLVSGYAFSGGALAMKLVRSGDLVAPVFLGCQLWRYCIWVDWRRVIMRQRSSGLRRVVMYLKGMKASFELEVDRHRCLYQSRTS